MRTHGRTTSTSDDGFRRIEVITGVGRRRRWTDEEKAWIVAESLDPAAASVSAVARRYGLHPSQLFVWRQQFAAPAAREAPAFVPVVIAEDDPAPAGTAGRLGQPQVHAHNGHSRVSSYRSTPLSSVDHTDTVK